jgi:hypothetical protein
LGFHDDLDSRPVYLHPGTGYMTVFYPEHPSSWPGTGYVYQHRVMMERELGRYLTSEEVVHHKDGDGTNNSVSNLELTTRSAHGRMHNPMPVRCCGHCGSEFSAPRKNGRKTYYCSRECLASALSKVTRPSKEELRILVWEFPTSQLARRFGVSDVAIAKWCKKYEIKKPPRGHWTKRHVDR